MSGERDLAWPVYFSSQFARDAAPHGQVTLVGDEAHHAIAVRRHRAGDWIVVADGDGDWVAGPIKVVAGKDRLEVAVQRVGSDPPLTPTLTVVQALPKSDRADSAIEFLTSVGVDRIVPWQATRSVAKWSGERASRGLARWRRTAREASKQSRRVRLPIIDVPVNGRQLAELVGKADAVLLCHEQASMPINDAVPAGADEIVVVIGPEGGIAPEELTELGAAGARAVSLGPTVLRTSLAGGLAAGLVMSRTGRFDARSGGVRP